MKRFTYLCLVALLLASVVPARADIFQWECIKQPIATVCPDGTDVDAVPGTYLYGKLTMAAVGSLSPTVPEPRAFLLRFILAALVAPAARDRRGEEVR